MDTIAAGEGRSAFPWCLPEQQHCVNVSYFSGYSPSLPARGRPSGPRWERHDHAHRRTVSETRVAFAAHFPLVLVARRSWLRLRLVGGHAHSAGHPPDLSKPGFLHLPVHLVVD